jgi:hypothetical protein
MIMETGLFSFRNILMLPSSAMPILRRAGEVLVNCANKCPLAG